jgi:type II secretory ATPase GspE/PulE/Tfp pilus assembly ATPase PilB-like protein
MNPFFELLTPRQKSLLAAAAPAQLTKAPAKHWPPEDFLHTLCDALGIPTLPISAENVDLASYERHRQLCAKFQFLPLFESGVVIQIASVQPWNEAWLMELRGLLEKEIHPLGVTETNLEQTLATTEGRLDLAKRNKPAESLPPPQPPWIAWPIDLKDTQHGFLRLVSTIIDEAHKRGVADIHIEPMEDRVRIRFRLDNSLLIMPPIERQHAYKVVEAFKIRANIPSEETAIEQRGRIRERTSVGPLDLRVQVTPSLHGQTVVCRLLDPRSLHALAGKLPFKDAQLREVQAHIDSYYGMILVTGPTGSGKSTTILRIITSLNRSALKIVTIEEPVEYSLDGIIQTDVSNGRMTFASALKAELRNDPDVIVVGEIRDQETAKIAIQAAQTGHLLMSTLHTNNTTETISRLLTLGCDPDEVRSSLRCVIAQRLVPRLCLHCRQLIPVTEKVASLYEAYGMSPGPSHIYTKKGCAQCQGEGTRGRLPVFEVLSLTDELKLFVLASFDADAFRTKWRREGGVTLGMYALNLVAAGEVDPGELDSLTAEVLSFNQPIAKSAAVA